MEGIGVEEVELSGSAEGNLPKVFVLSGEVLQDDFFVVLGHHVGGILKHIQLLDSEL